MMQTTHSSLTGRKRADALLVPITQDHGKAVWPTLLKKRPPECDGPLQLKDFSAKEGETLVIYPAKQEEPRWILFGLGDASSLTTEKLRRGYSNAAKQALKVGCKSINVLTPTLQYLAEEQLFQGASEGLFLTNYRFDRLKGKDAKKEPLLQEMHWITDCKKALPIAKHAWVICEGVHMARDLVNGNADDVTPEHLTEVAKSIAKSDKGVKATILDRKQMAKLGMELLLAVGRGSTNPPYMIILEYKGAPKSKEQTVLIGKGVTYDTGGLNIKPTGSMETMKCDMGGAAAVLAAFATAVKLKLKVNLVVVVPTTENSIDANSYKPGDVYGSYLGKTVEIGNTDAEGRLILADALAYSVEHFKPTRVIDVATLTGAIEIALGNETTGLFSNNDALADGLIRAGSDTFERVWRMPIHEEYREQLKSEIADIKNHGGRSGGSITAALFLQEFVGKTPWAHLDVAGTAYVNEAKRYHGRFGTGIGVRLLVEYLESLAT
jgi:leucyl aminopeptidase